MACLCVALVILVKSSTSSYLEMQSSFIIVMVSFLMDADHYNDVTAF